MTNSQIYHGTNNQDILDSEMIKSIFLTFFGKCFMTKYDDVPIAICCTWNWSDRYYIIAFKMNVKSIVYSSRIHTKLAILYTYTI